MIIGSAEVEVRPSSDGFAAQLESDLTPGVTSVAKKLGGILAAAISVREVGQFFQETVAEASEAEEAASKVGVVFGDMSESVTDFAANSAEAFGQSNNQALEATATFGNLFRAIELTETQSAEMATTLTGLASDLASFNNVEVDDALTALRSGLVGETEPLKRFGVNLNEATIKQEALNLGLEVGAGVLDASVKAQAAYSLILKQTALAQGDFERTSDGLANQQRILTAEWDNAKTEIGVGLLPVAKELVEVARGNLIPTVVDLASSAVPLLIQGFEVAQPLLGITTSTLQAMAPALEAVATIIDAIPEPLLNAAVLGYGLTRAYSAIGGAAATAGRQAMSIDWSGPLTNGTAAAGTFEEGLTRGSRAAGGFRESLRGMTTGLNGVMLTAGLATTAISLWNDMMNEGRERAEEFGEGVRTSVTADIASSTAPFETLTAKLAAVRDGVADLSETWAGSSAPWDIGYRRELAEGIEQLGQTEDQLVTLRDEAERLAGIYGLTANEVLKLAQANGIDLAGAAELAASKNITLAEATAEIREEFGDAAREADNFGSVTGTAIDPVQGLTEALDEEREKIDGVREALRELTDAQLTAADSDLAYREAVADLSDETREYEEAAAAAAAAEREHGAGSAEAAAAARDLRDAGFDLEGSMLAQANAAVRLAEDQAKAAGGTLQAEEADRILRAELQRMLEATAPDSPLRGALSGLIQNLHDVPGVYTASVDINVDQRELDSALAKLNRLESLGLGLSAEAGQAEKFVIRAAGAADGFSGTVRSPTMFLTGEGGEPEDVLVVPQSLGGVSKVVAELAAALSGGQGSFGGGRGGMVVQPGAIVVNESNDGRSAAMQVVKRLRGAGFRGGLSGVLR